MDDNKELLQIYTAAVVDSDSSAGKCCIFCAKNLMKMGISAAHSSCRTQ